MLYSVSIQILYLCSCKYLHNAKIANGKVKIANVHVKTAYDKAFFHILRRKRHFLRATMPIIG